MTYFLTNADFVHGGQADWSIGMGTLKVFVDDMLTPVLVVPLNLDGTLELEHGRGWVGFTAATGTRTWQTHDILSWSFTSLREPIPERRPPLINDIGAHTCQNESVCVHQ